MFESTSHMLVLTKGLFNIRAIGFGVVISEKQYYKARVAPHEVPIRINLVNL